jgi:hypothetical protein
MSEPESNLQSLIEPACRLIAQGAVPSIVVSIGRPLDVDELSGFRQYATQCGVLLTEVEAGTVLLRGGVHRMVGPRLGVVRSLLAGLSPRGAAAAADVPMNPGWAR